ncbi:MAG: aminoacyl-tRNA hydrolase [Thermodesulfobacteriota bacterium]
MYLIVGLGNPGDKYRKTRHNIGFHAVEQLAEEIGIGFSESKWKALVCKGDIAGQGVVLVKPQTFMNLSGEAVEPIASYYKIPQENIVVIHDDLDLDCGRIKLCVNSGAGGHNGIKSLIQRLGGNSFNRIKVGIGRPLEQMPVERYVLAKFTDEESLDISSAINRAVEAVTLIVEKGMAAATQAIHTR